MSKKRVNDPAIPKNKPKEKSVHVLLMELELKLK